MDIISWHGCRLQREMNPEEFCHWQKMRALCESVQKTAAIPLAKLNMKVPDLAGDMVQISYTDLTAQVAAVAARAKDCEVCFPSDGGSPSYVYVGYPIDGIAETALFEVFTQQLAEPDSPASQLLADAGSDDSTGSQAIWAGGRGAGGLLELNPPRVKSIGGRAITSTQVLDVLFRNAEGLELVTAYGLFWLALRKHVLNDTEVSSSDSARRIASLGELFARTFAKGAQGSPVCSVYFYA